MKKFLILLYIFLSVNVATSQDTCRLEIGTNLGGPSDWGVSWPFIDIMKLSREWITFNSVWIDGGENAWDTQLLNSIPCDDNGYPLELPYHVEGAETTQVVRTVWANTFEMPAGTYTVLYDGVGRIEVGFDAVNVDYGEGRIEFDMKEGERDGIIYLAIMESQLGNHIRNIKVLLPDTEELLSDTLYSYHKNIPYNPVWLEKVNQFGAIRFMDWAKTNNSYETYWQDRAKQTDYTWTSYKGIPYEEYIRLCNTINANAWICIPHRAEDEYIREMAELFRDGLDPNLKIYVEYSNELWNWIFDQTHYCYDNGDQETPWPERIVPFIQNALDIWSDVFSDEMFRIKRVVGVQMSYLDVSRRIAENLREGSVDILSPTAYFHLNEESYQILDSLGEAASPEKVIELARESIDDEAYGWLLQQKELSEELNLELSFYEAGQHLTPNPWGSEQPYNQALIDANYHEDMYELYNYWLNLVRNVDSTKKLFMHFTLAGPVSGRYGSFGALRNIYDESPYLHTSPKYLALLENNCPKYSDEILQVKFNKGWNLVSVNRQLSDTSIDIVLKDLNFVIAKDDSGNIYFPDYNFNNIENWSYSEAYKIYSNEYKTLIFSGDTLVYNSIALELAEGWNYLPYLKQNEENIESALSEIVNANITVIVNDRDGNTFIPAMNINTIGNMKPGDGYLIYVNQDYTFYY